MARDFTALVVVVIPVKTGIQPEPRERFGWPPAFAGVTLS